MRWVVKQAAPRLLLSMRVSTQAFPTVGKGKEFSTSLQRAERLACFCLFKMSPNWEGSVLHYIFGNFFRVRQVVSLCRPLIPPCADLIWSINTSPERPMMSCTWRSCYLLPPFPSPNFLLSLCILSNLRSSLFLQMQTISNVCLHTPLCIYICVYIYVHIPKTKHKLKLQSLHFNKEPDPGSWKHWGIKRKKERNKSLSTFEI